MLTRASFISAAVLGWMVCLVGAGSTPQTPSQPVPRFRSGVEAVVLDVSVLDSERRPVRGLTADDFTILEDGAPQALTAFTAVDVPDVEEPSAAWVRDVAPDIRRNDEASDRRIVILVMDDATPMPADEVLRARALARLAIQHLGPGDLAAVVYAFDKKAGQGLTTDRARLLAAVDLFNGAIDRMPEMNAGVSTSLPFSSFNTSAAMLYQATAATLRAVAEYLTDIPQRRKALLFVSVGLPLDIDLMEPQVIGQTTGDSTGAARQIQTDLQELIRAAQRANVNIYGLDPGGLRSPAPPSRSINVDTGTVTIVPSEAGAGTLNREFLRGLAGNTGGFVVTNSNDPDPDLAQIVRENGSYYLLGYQPTNARAAGRFRKIEVRVSRPGVTVRTRSGYNEPTPEKPRPVAPLPALSQAVAGFAPKADLSMQVAAAPFLRPGARDASVAIVLRMRQPAPSGSDRIVENVGVLVNAYDPDGKRRGSERLDGRVVLRPAPGQDATYEVLSQLDLKPGRYELRIAAESSMQQKSGSVFYDVDVPDFAKSALTLSGVVLSVTPGVAVAPKDKLAALIPVVPTSQREFSNDDQVSAFLRIYQFDKDPVGFVNVSVSVIDAAGVRHLGRRETLGAESFTSGRSADYRIDLPVADLLPGQYLLTIEARKAQASARRDVRFIIKDAP